MKNKSKLSTINYQLSTSLGFTVIEMLASIFAMAIIFTLLTAVFVQLLNIQRRAFNMQHAQENSIFILEAIAKEIRVSQINTSGRTADTCYSDLDFTHPDNGVVRYELAGNNFIRRAGGVDQTLNSNNISLERLSFCLGYLSQPRVSIVLRIVSGVGKAAAAVDTQTTIAQRYLNP